MDWLTHARDMIRARQTGEDRDDKCPKCGWVTQCMLFKDEKEHFECDKIGCGHIWLCEIAQNP